MEGFALFALLPLGLASFFSRDLKRADAGILGLLGALAPVVAKGVGNLIGSKQKKAQAKRDAEYERQAAAAEEAASRAKFEAAQNSPQAAMSRLGFNTRLAQILGRFGGREKTPGFLLNAFDTARKTQEYVPGAAYVPPAQQGGGFWGFAGGLADALSYFDPSKLKKTSSVPGPVGLEGAKIDRRTAAPSTPPFAVTQTQRTPFK